MSDQGCLAKLMDKLLQKNLFYHASFSVWLQKKIPFGRLCKPKFTINKLIITVSTLL